MQNGGSIVAINSFVRVQAMPNNDLRITVSGGELAGKMILEARQGIVEKMHVELKICTTSPAMATATINLLESLPQKGTHLKIVQQGDVMLHMVNFVGSAEIRSFENEKRLLWALSVLNDTHGLKFRFPKHFDKNDALLACAIATTYMQGVAEHSLDQELCLWIPADAPKALHAAYSGHYVTISFPMDVLVFGKAFTPRPMTLTLCRPQPILSQKEAERLFANLHAGTGLRLKCRVDHLIWKLSEAIAQPGSGA